MREGVRSVDANLLLALHALLEERNLTHAGNRLMMSQPAMSGALGRLRNHFDDELLIRTGRDFELSPLAQRLRPVVARAVESAEALVGTNREFDPASSRKQFAVTLSEYAMTVLAEPLSRAIEARAPHATIAYDTLPGRWELLEGQLGRRDLIVGPRGFDLPGQSSPLYTDHLVCIVAKGHPRLRDGRLSLQDLHALPHAVAEFIAGAPVRRPLEQVAEQAGLGDRHILVQVTSLLAVPFAVAGTELVGFVPSRLARRCLPVLDLVIAETPLEPVLITEEAHWHPRRINDPAGLWLREILYDVAVQLEDDLDA
ncbi:LysR family transcriptional regulator [Actinomycetota bacterium]